MRPSSPKRRQLLQLASSAPALALLPEWTIAQQTNGQQPAQPQNKSAALCRDNVEATVGPYPSINPLERRDLRGNTGGDKTPKEGAQLTLKMRIQDIENSCAPISDAIVDIWCAEATGNYSGYKDFGTAGQDYCRGYQRTDANGQVEFVTLYPGSYEGRAIHIHFAIQSAASNLRPDSHGRRLATIFVAQMYFTKEMTDEVFRDFPIYQKGAKIIPNESDYIYRGEGGSGYIVRITKSGKGYVGEIDIGVKRTAVGLAASSQKI